MCENLDDSLSQKKTLTFLDFINEAIWALKRVIPMYAAVLIVLYLWSLFHPEIKSLLLEMQNALMGMFS